MDSLARHLCPKQLDEVHLPASERVTDARARHVTLWPCTRVHCPVITGIHVVVEAVDIVVVEDQRPSTTTTNTAVHQGSPVVRDDVWGRGGRRRRTLTTTPQPQTTTTLVALPSPGSRRL